MSLKLNNIVKHVVLKIVLYSGISIDFGCVEKERYSFIFSVHLWKILSY